MRAETISSASSCSVGATWLWTPSVMAMVECPKTRPPLDRATRAVWRDHRRQMLQERLLVGAGFVDEGLVFHQPDGTCLKPDAVSAATGEQPAGVHGGQLVRVTDQQGLRIPTVELTGNRRQHHAWERDALGELRTGVPAAVAAYTGHGRIVPADTADAAREELVGDWWTAREEHGRNAVMIAARRSDVDDLNTRARHRRTVAGHLTGPVLDAAGGDVDFLREGVRVLASWSSPMPTWD